MTKLFCLFIYNTNARRKEIVITSKKKKLNGYVKTTLTFRGPERWKGPSFEKPLYKIYLIHV